MTSRNATATMLVRKPIDTVFEAFVRPDIITRFWLEAASAPLREGAKVTWRFMVPGASDNVVVTAFEPPHLIAFDWSDGKHVRLSFKVFKAGITLVTAEISGFDARADVSEIVNAAEGFTIVLCDLKTLMESGVSAGLVRDKAELIAASRE